MAPKTKKLEVGNICKPILDWARDDKLKEARVKVTGSQINGKQLFYRVDWIDDDEGFLFSLYGMLFTSAELQKVKDK